MKNWRTTIVGLFGAIWIVAEPIISAGQIDWKALATAIVVAALGYFAKDAGVTGTAK